MKRILKIILTVVLTLFALQFLYFVFVPHAHESTHSAFARLVVNERDLGAKKTVIYRHGDDDFAYIPLTEVIAGLGYDVVWDELGVAHIQVEGRRFTLSGDVISDDDTGKIISQGKGIHASRIEQRGHTADCNPNELMMDLKDVRLVLYRMGFAPVRIEIERKARQVIVAGDQPTW